MNKRFVLIEGLDYSIYDGRTRRITATTDVPLDKKEVEALRQKSSLYGINNMDLIDPRTGRALTAPILG